ncbi:OapC/ArvC family zinc-ribbon domain-containing protein [Natrialba aegyptia]|uniref:OapC/ArvC family zinc-ribbon domain-containing protein n=1 Tax=Natrialba aegyptia TaxID=129789 RepID=UPI000A06D027|nr:Zn-ribbon containing protein [Natrialba aegyptia]
MPHECTNCGRTFPDGSKEMLSGCPDCNGNKFQFTPSSAMGSADSSAGRNSAAEQPSDSVKTGSESKSGMESESDSSGMTSRAAETVRDWVSRDEADASVDESSAWRSTGSSSSSPSSSETAETAAADTSSAGDSSAETAEEAESGELGSFEEWPDTARRPEDRSTSPEGGHGNVSESSSNSSSGSNSSPSSDVEPRSAAPADSETSSGSASSAGPDSSASPSRMTMADSENTAQSDARSEVVPTDELPTGSTVSSESDSSSPSDPTSPPASGPGSAPPTDSPSGNAQAAAEGSPDHGRVVSEPTGETPSMEELREELNKQFESIKIVQPGQYELNLMELYNREEYIISLQEDGRYVIDVPDSWRDEGE